VQFLITSALSNARILQPHDTSGTLRATEGLCQRSSGRVAIDYICAAMSWPAPGGVLGMLKGSFAFAELRVTAPVHTEPPVSQKQGKNQKAEPSVY